jgi:hypothetical protein
VTDGNGGRWNRMPMFDDDHTVIRRHVAGCHAEAAQA